MGGDTLDSRPAYQCLEFASVSSADRWPMRGNAFHGRSQTDSHGRLAYALRPRGLYCGRIGRNFGTPSL